MQVDGSHSKTTETWKQATETAGQTPFQLSSLCDRHATELIHNADFHRLYDLKGRALPEVLVEARAALPVELAEALSQLGGAIRNIDQVPFEPAPGQCQLCQCIATCGCGEGVRCLLHRQIARVVQDLARKEPHPLNTCERHWQEIETGLQARGLQGYSASSPAEGQLRVMSGEFDPRGLVLTLVSNTALDRAGFSVLLGGCLPCYLMATCSCVNQRCSAGKIVELSLEHVYSMGLEAGVVHCA
jgi:hypothetical protein